MSVTKSIRDSIEIIVNMDLHVDMFNKPVSEIMSIRSCMPPSYPKNFRY